MNKLCIWGVMTMGVLFLTSCEETPLDTNRNQSSNALVGYKWVNVLERMIDGEHTTYTATLCFMTDSTGMYKTEFVAPNYHGGKDYALTYTFDGKEGKMNIEGQSGVKGKITYDDERHELHWWKLLTYDGRRDSSLVFTRHDL